MRRSTFVVSSVLLCTALTAFSQTAVQTAPPGQPVAPRPPAPPAYACEPVTPNASPEARALLKNLCALTGKGILSGQHNYPNERAKDTDLVYAATGKYPAVWGSDFGFLDGEDKDSIIHRDLMIEEAKKQAAAGATRCRSDLAISACADSQCPRF
ncbi:MAG: glycosyl hydrolase [Bryobacteraceae bacterium]|nr:glycosyl hydrolase [Bryobacteraceae bacterium]